MELKWKTEDSPGEWKQGGEQKVEVKIPCFFELLDSIFQYNAIKREGKKQLEYFRGELKPDSELFTEKEAEFVEKAEKAYTRVSAAIVGANKFIANLKEHREELLRWGAVDCLDGEKMTADFQLLSLPVVLSQEQAKLLYQKHWNNPLFVEALNTYAKKHGLNTQDWRDPVLLAIDSANTVFFKAHGIYVNGVYATELETNPNLIKEYDKALDAVLETVY